MTIQNRQYLHMIRQYLDESPDITYVIDRKTRKVVLGPVGTGTAKAFVQKQIQPRKFLIRDLKEPTKKVGDTIGMFESTSLTTENAHDFGLDSDNALSGIIQNVPMPERKIMARMVTKVLTDAVGFDNLERDIGPNGYTGRNVHLLSMEDLQTIEDTDPRSYKKIMNILMKYESTEEEVNEGTVMDQIRQMVQKHSMDDLKLDDGSKMPLDVQSANAVLMVYNAMNKGNQKRFEEKLSSSSKDALKVVKFAQKMVNKG